MARGIKSIELPMEDYKPNGAYPEGYSYWGYGTSFHVLFNSAMEKVLGRDGRLPENQGFFKTAGYLQHMTGPSGECFNYSDSGVKGELQPAMFWFARKLNEPSLLWVEREQLMKKDASTQVRDRLLPAVMIWSQGTKMNDITEPKQKLWIGQGKNPVAMTRTSCSDLNAIYVGVKAGSPSVNHGHMDVGSFIMEANGVRLAMDFEMQNYESLESKGFRLWGREQDAQRWEVFRYNNRAHNTLTVNNQLQRVEGYATIKAHADNPAFTYAITDIAQVYKGLLSKAQRGIAIVNQKYVAVRDEIQTLNEECTIRWTMLTSADVSITGKDKIQLTQHGKKLPLQIQHPAKVVMKTWPTTPLKDYDALNLWHFSNRI